MFSFTARIFTVLQESADPLLVFQYMVSVTANILVIVFAIVYTVPEAKRR